MGRRHYDRIDHFQERKDVVVARAAALPWDSPKSYASAGFNLSEKTNGDCERKKLRSLLNDCAAGFYQEMYFLGKDVIHDEGNQLREYGFVRTSSRGMSGTSCYTFDADTATIELYGSCACCYCQSTQIAFIRIRSRFYHWRAEERCVAGLWGEEDIDAGSPEQMYHDLAPLLQWWLDYEQWITERHGEGYREECFKEWRKVNKRKSWLDPKEAMQWVQLFLEKGSSHVRPKNFTS